jgi:hypothetical protein
MHRHADVLGAESSSAVPRPRCHIPVGLMKAIPALSSASPLPSTLFLALVVDEGEWSASRSCHLIAGLAHCFNNRGHPTYWQEYAVNFMISLSVLLGPR